LENGETVILREGDCINIPPGFRHNEIRTSDNLEALEFTSPAVMETVPVDAPAGMK
jgi:mannose-6-phosphate isomerase-like protein (cupin superfamily)